MSSVVLIHGAFSVFTSGAVIANATVLFSSDAQIIKASLTVIHLAVINIAFCDRFRSKRHMLFWMFVGIRSKVNVSATMCVGKRTCCLVLMPEVKESWPK